MHRRARRSAQPLGLMRSVAGILSVLFALTPLACSEISGLELAVVGEVPSDIDATISRAAVAAGFVSTDLRHPLGVKDAGSHYFELPRADAGETVTVQTFSSSGELHIRIGRSIYTGYTVAEATAASTLVSSLRESGLVLRKAWSNKLVLAKDLERWLKGNLRNEA